MLAFDLPNCLTLALVVSLIGAYGLLTRRSLVMILLSIEVMLSGANISVVAFNYFVWSGRAYGHYLYMLSIGVAAVEAAIGLGMAIVYFRNHQDISRERAGRLHEGDA
ncbi:MAG: NADH-quinone oxidoreductase subunit NuoK [Myxococcales bacterium]|nr:NADH-quinone oxidoreductase subunit NuoK [Myxococcales bacterium]